MIYAIQERLREDHALDATGITHGPHSDACLYEAGRKLFSSWPDALRTAGVEPATLKPPRWSADEVTGAIRKRSKEKKPLNRTSLESGKDCEHSLLKAALDFFGCWDNALEAAGFDPATTRVTRKRNLTSKGVIIAELKDRGTAGKPLNAAALKTGQHRDTHLYKEARKHFGSWAVALEAAGFDPEEIYVDKTKLRKSRSPS